MGRKWETAWARAYKDTETFRKGSPVWFWGVEVLGAALFALFGGYQGICYSPNNPTSFQQYWYQGAGTAIGLVLGFVMIWILIYFFHLLRAPYRQRDEVRKQIDDFLKGHGMPKIICSKPYEGLASAQDPALEIYIKEIDVASVSFRNESPDISAPNTWVQVIYRDDARNDELQEDILSIFPMWENEGVVGSGLSNMGDARVIELEPNGIWRTIVLAVKYPTDKVCYAYNHESYKYKDLRNPSFKLNGKKFEIEIILNGKGIEGENFFFELTNVGKGEGLVLKRKL